MSNQQLAAPPSLQVGSPVIATVNTVIAIACDYQNDQFRFDTLS
jgi:hypothetical protein